MRILSSLALVLAMTLPYGQSWLGLCAMARPDAEASTVRSSTGSFCRESTSPTGPLVCRSATRQASTVSVASLGRRIIMLGMARRLANCSIG